MCTHWTTVTFHSLTSPHQGGQIAIPPIVSLSSLLHTSTWLSITPADAQRSLFLLFLPLLSILISFPYLFRRLVPQGHPSLNPTTPWSLPPPSPPPSPLCPTTAPPGYAAWAWTTIIPTMKGPAAERYLVTVGAQEKEDSLPFL